MDIKDISDRQILKWINKAYIRQPDVKEQVKEIKHKRENNARAFVPLFANQEEYVKSFKKANKMLDEMADILYKHIVNDTKSADGTRHGLENFPRSAIIVEHMKWSPSAERRRITYKGTIYFDKEALKRESLAPEKYSGIDDIIELFVHGYNARGSVSGEWHGEQTWSLKHRPNANDTSFYSNGNFMQNAIDEFNAKYSGKKQHAKAFIPDNDYDINQKKDKNKKNKV